MVAEKIPDATTLTVKLTVSEEACLLMKPGTFKLGVERVVERFREEARDLYLYHHPDADYDSAVPAVLTEPPGEWTTLKDLQI